MKGSSGNLAADYGLDLRRGCGRGRREENFSEVHINK